MSGTNSVGIVNVYIFCVLDLVLGSLIYDCLNDLIVVYEYREPDRFNMCSIEANGQSQLVFSYAWHCIIHTLARPDHNHSSSSSKLANLDINAVCITLYDMQAYYNYNVASCHMCISVDN